MTHLSANPPEPTASPCAATSAMPCGSTSSARWPGDAALQHERLPQAPSRWYLTGFLAPGDAPERATGAGQRGGARRAGRAAAWQVTMRARRIGAATNASSCPRRWASACSWDEETNRLDVAVSWGDYAPEIADTPDAAGGPESAGGARDAPAESAALAAREDGESPDATAAPDVAGGARGGPAVIRCVRRRPGRRRLAGR